MSILIPTIVKCSTLPYRIVFPEIFQNIFLLYRYLLQVYRWIILNVNLIFGIPSRDRRREKKYD